jgi:hypothetical protein
LTEDFSADGKIMKYFQRLFAAGLMLICGLTAESTNSDAAENGPLLFVTGERCMACHNGLTGPSGNDVSIGTDWRSSMMANSSRDPYWHAAVRREVSEHPAAASDIENECSKCHMPMSRFESKIAGVPFGIFSNLPGHRNVSRSALLAADGVSCTACHQIEGKGLGKKESFTGGFSIDSQLKIGQRPIYGPYEVDEGRRMIMQSSSGFSPMAASHIGSSEVCAMCHTLYTHTLDENGQVIGELPEQVPYLEWRHSAYSPNRSCQSCHLPRIDTPMPISSVLGQPRDRLARHAFRGGNFFIPRMLNLYRDQLNLAALPQELDAASQRALDHLATSAAAITITDVRLSQGRLIADVEIENFAGHKLPTAYPSRRAWIHFTVRDRLGDIVFESGALAPDGSIQGNDNDSDARNFEPHYAEIDDPEKVQLYEAIMADSSGNVTTGLLKGIRYVKDNRLLPEGFNKMDAPKDVAVHGEARNDRDFQQSTDRIRYAVELNQAGGPYIAQAELCYQPIGYRWAQNLRPLNLQETRQFVSFYESMADVSATVLARTVATVK